MSRVLLATSPANIAAKSQPASTSVTPFLNSIIKGDCVTGMENLPDNSVDMIFADPPYNFETEQFLKIVDLVFERELLNDEGVLIIEHSKHTTISHHKKYRYSKRYGGNVFSFFEEIAT